MPPPSKNRLSSTREAAARALAAAAGAARRGRGRRGLLHSTDGRGDSRRGRAYRLHRAHRALWARREDPAACRAAEGGVVSAAATLARGEAARLSAAAFA